MKPRTIPISSVKQEFLEKWLKGLQTYSKFNDKMSVLERKHAIKSSADIAIASTRKPATHWSRATMEQNLNTTSTTVIKCKNKNLQQERAAHCIKEKARRRRSVAPSRSRRVESVFVAKKLVKSRTRVLKGLVPGGHAMDGACLIKETLDYIASLRVQVDVMRHFAEGLDNQQRWL